MARAGSVAVVIPCFNAGNTLGETVASVLAQRRPAREIVVVDDGSDDASTRQALARLPSAVRVLWQAHGGVARARDAGVRETRSEYLLWLDADDLLAPEYLEVTAGELDERPDLDIVATGFEAFGAERFSWTPPDPSALELHFAEGTFLVTALFRRSLWEVRGGADAGLPALEDWEYWLRALAAGHQALVVEQPLVRVRTSAGSRRLRGLEGDRVSPALHEIIARHRDTIVALGPRLIEAKKKTLSALAGRHDALHAELRGREAILGPGARRSPRSVVLMYHRAAELRPDAFGLCVPPALLARQLDAVKAAFPVVGVTTLLDGMVAGKAPERAVAVSFDDGYLDALTAAELLEARGLPAIFFVNTEGLDEPHESWEAVLEQLLLGPHPIPRALSLSVGHAKVEIGAEGTADRRVLFDRLHALGYSLDAQGRKALIDSLVAWSGLTPRVRESHRVLTRGEIAALASRRGMEIGVHGASHLALPLHPPAVQEHELASAKAALEALLGRPVVNLAYAYGAHDPQTVAIAARLGFRSAFVVEEAPLSPWDDPLTLPRIDVGCCEPEALVERIERLLAAAPPKGVPAGEAAPVALACEDRPAAAQAALSRCLRGEISAPIALLHLVPEFEDPAALFGFLEESAQGLPAGQGALRLQALSRFAQDHLAGLSVVRQMGVHHAEAAAQVSTRGIRAIRELYDRLAEMDPSSAVALYAFGDPGILDRATAEVVAYLGQRGLLSPSSRLLELGCGIGRLLEACAERCGEVTGVDVSPRMVALAGARLERLRNARVQLCNGNDLEGFLSESQDVVVAADSWPHVVMLGPYAMRRLAQEVARVLAPGGEFVVLNFSYRPDPSADAADVGELASALGFAIVEAGNRPFVLWDAVAWRLRRTLG